MSEIRLSFIKICRVILLSLAQTITCSATVIKQGRDMASVVTLISTIIQIFIWLLIANAILSWLVAFNVINTRNQFVSSVGQFLYKLTEPVLRPIRRVIPAFGGIDISPIVLILLLIFLQNLMFEYLLR